MSHVSLFSVCEDFDGLTLADMLKLCCDIEVSLALLLFIHAQLYVVVVVVVCSNTVEEQKVRNVGEHTQFLVVFLFLVSTLQSEQKLRA